MSEFIDDETEDSETSNVSPDRSAAVINRILGRDARATALGDKSTHSHHADDGDQFELQERASLRRVAGLSTELEDVTEVEYRQLRLEKVVLIGIWSGNAEEAENSLRELAALAETAGSEVLDGLLQRRATPDPATFLGKGKADELRQIVAACGADTVIADTELAPSQRRALEDVVKVKVIDRTAVILDIFAQHAKSREGKAQVELAQLEYPLPRLRGWVSLCPARPVVRLPVVWAWAPVVRVRPRSSWTAAVSTPAWQSFASKSRK